MRKRFDFRSAPALYASKWHMLNYQGQSFADIGKKFGFSEQEVCTAVQRFRLRGDYLSPEDKRQEKLQEKRWVIPLTLPERHLLKLIIEQDEIKQPTTICTMALIARKSQDDITNLMLSLQEKQYIALQKSYRHKLSFAVPLMNEAGKIYTPKYMIYKTGKDGVKRYKNPLYAEGYVQENRDIGRIKGER